MTPHRDGTPTEHGFVSYFAWSDDTAGLVWLDGRHTELAHVNASEHDHVGEMALRTAALGPDRALDREAVLDVRVCDCCNTAAGITSAGPPGADDPPISAAPALVSHSQVVWLEPPDGAEFLDPVPGGTSTMHRNRHGISASMTATELEPETVYTLWWIVFNNPEYCATTPCGAEDLDNPDVNGGVFGGNGQVSDAWGRVHLTAHVFAGEDPGLDRPFADFGLAAGLVDAFKAEIHLLIRSHGPAADLSPAELEAAFNYFIGGCAEFGAGPADCIDPQAAAHLP